MTKYLFVPLMLLLFVNPAFAKVNVVTTLPWIGSVAREIGKDYIDVTTLIKPNQDPHFAEAKPSMILAARKADIIMYNGLDLEIGYLPRIIESSNNPKIQPGKRGYLDCSQFIEAIEKPSSVDRSMGDVHPLGNPHYHLSSKNILKVAEGMTTALSGIDPGNTAYYSNNLQSFKDTLNEKLKQWGKKSLKGRRYVTNHKYFEYLAREFGFQITGYIEPKPGIPPSAGHIEKLIEMMKKTMPNAILTTAYSGKKEADLLSLKTGVKVKVLPHDVGASESVRDWISLMDTIIMTME